MTPMDFQEQLNQQMNMYLEVIERGLGLGYFKDLIESCVALWNLNWNQAQMRIEREYRGAR